MGDSQVKSWSKLAFEGPLAEEIPHKNLDLGMTKKGWVLIFSLLLPYDLQTGSVIKARKH